jgi:hypothetical protein
LDNGFILNIALGIGVSLLLILYIIACTNVLMDLTYLFLQFGPYNNFIVLTAARVPMRGPSQYTA